MRRSAPKTKSTEKPKRQRKSREARRSQTEISQGAIAYGGLIEEYHDPTMARLAVQVGAFAVVGFLGWASIAPVHELTIGQGEILPTGFVQKVQHLEGGNVAQIFVDEGSEVTQGDPLIQLSDLSVRAELTKAQSRLEYLNLAIQRQAQISTGIVQDLLANSSGQFDELLRSQQVATAADEDFRSAQLKVLEAEIQSRSAEMAGLNTRVEKLSAELELVSKQYEDYQRAQLSGAVSQREVENVLRDKLRLESDQAALQGQYQAAQASVLEAQARIEELQARFRQEAGAQITDLEVQRAETQELVAQLQDRLNKMIVRAPVDGVLNSISVRNAGQVVTPGAVVAEIVPDSGDIFAEVDIPTDQIGYVHEGMDANVKVLTYDFARFGAIEGIVADVSPTSIMDEKGNYFYRVRIALDQPYVGDQGEGRLVTPGMAVTADIILGNKSVLSYLLKPLRAISDRAFSER